MEKKQIGWYIVGICTVIVLLALLFYTGYHFAYESTKKEMEEKKEQMEKIREEQQKETVPESSPAGKSAVSVDAMKEQKITAKTRCILEIYGVEGELIEEKEIDVPGELIGCTRTEAVEYATEYMTDIPIKEYLDGLVSYEVVSFSEDELTLRKTYDDDAVEFRYYLVAKDDEVVVYYSDKRTIYEYTGIKVSGLSKEDQKDLSHGILVTDDEELYGILEGYSS